jgi:glycosyltransferase involved in cell wall biosynthesis
LASQSVEPAGIVVVDNAPSDGATELAVKEAHNGLRVTYVREDRPGLSCARNRAVRELVAGGASQFAPIDHTVVAWLDDDETADPNWVAAIAAAFDRHPRASAVSGLVLAGSLQTDAEFEYEELGGLTKGRGFSELAFGPGMDQSPLMPAPPFGVGANMAVRLGSLIDHPFDELLGAGTPTFACEDTLFFAELLESHHQVVFDPAILTRHFHRADKESLARQMDGYRVGLGAYYAALVIDHPSRLPRLVGTIPAAAKWYLSSARQPRPATTAPVSTKGHGGLMLRGAVAYGRSRMAMRARGRRR